MQNYLALSTADEVLFVFPCLCFFMPRRCRLWAASPALQWRRYVFTMSRCVSRANIDSSTGQAEWVSPLCTC